ncbi:MULTISPECIES: enoyl-CoA hydratase/isomerase family protein [unclassified Pseudofrankia]|uniref:enoyl-CoA hydratase/isomerase family protein n=1 Tax=unclassified Pseudofrankia TaxID=2994372 RepID=UPI0008D95142|nr:MULTISPECIES: enoyl-CoA hydratase/isomerase family protein [unclassified Pseudofrankia]MDT3445624.1 enoyl-CoA hydratase/isomerase family protein [Pseudofrankia sp. BMG5.37]OHV63527.1 hypothetical protein BCD48_38040 [Pseudofrankia sp. BMG5.36]
MTGLVVVSRHGRVAHVQLADGERNNALGPQLVSDLREAIRDATDLGSAVVLSAQGKHFCAGGDHSEAAALTADEFRGYLVDLVSLFDEVTRCPVPVVVCVQRGAIGGGVELALCGDLVVAGTDAYFSLPQIPLGIRVGEYTYRSLVARVGLSLARRMVLLGERVPAATAWSAGLADRLAEPVDLVDAGLELASTLAGCRPSALERARSAFNDVVGSADLLRAEVARRSGSSPAGSSSALGRPDGSTQPRDWSVWSDRRQ